MNTSVEIRRSDDWPEDVTQIIRGWTQEAFGDGGGYTWSKSNWRAVLVGDGQPLSQVEIVERTGLLDGKPVKLGGIGAVVTPPEYRGKGYASMTMQAADDFMRDQLGIEYGLLICGRERLNFYGRLGWQRIDGPMVFEQPGKSRVTWADGPWADTQVMVLPFGGRTWPGGEIDICGLPW